MKKLFKKNKALEVKIPRSAEEIKKQYYQLVAQAGEFQYQVAVYTETLASLNAELRKLNVEMAERQNLDKVAATENQAATTKGA